MTAHHVCTFKSGQHRAEAWQAPKGHRVVHVESGERVHSIAVPVHIYPPHFAALEVAKRVDPGHTPHAATPIDPDLIDIIR